MGLTYFLAILTRASGYVFSGINIQDLLQHCEGTFHLHFCLYFSCFGLLFSCCRPFFLQYMFLSNKFVVLQSLKVELFEDIGQGCVVFVETQDSV